MSTTEAKPAFGKAVPTAPAGPVGAPLSRTGSAGEPTLHVAVIDDHADIRQLLATHLKRYGFKVSTADSAASYRRLAAKARHDIVVLDVMMPEEDGLSLCRELRASSNVPVILLTAMGEATDRIVGLEIGADDYVTKPFEPRELVARIKAVLRRAHALPPMAESPESDQVRFEGRIFEISKRRLIGPDGIVTPLSTAETKLLRALIEHRGMVLSREQILDITRGKSADVFDRSVDNQISRLRRKLEPDPKNPTIVTTCWGGGYVFAPDVEWL